MQGRLDKEGCLAVNRRGNWTAQFCPHLEEARCGDWCPHLKEFILPHFEESQMLELGCNGANTTIEVVEDERKEG